MWAASQALMVFEVRGVPVVVDGVGLGHAHHVSGLDRAGGDEVEVLEFPGAQGDEVLVAHGPQVVALVDEELEAEAGAALLDEVGGPGAEVLDAPDPHPGGVDVDPVVREAVLFRHHQRHREKVPVTQVLRRGHRLGRGRRIHRQHQRRNRRRRNHVVGRDHALEHRAVLAAGDDGDRARALALGPRDLLDERLELDGAALLADLLRARLPHHARPVLRIVELIDQRRDLLRAFSRIQRVHDGTEEREVLDALRRPVRRQFAGVHAPHLLGVGLEEDAEKTLAETRGDPPVEVVLILRRPDLRPGVGTDAFGRFDHAQALERVAGLERVVEQLAPVVDP